MQYQQKLKGENCRGLCVKNGEKQREKASTGKLEKPAWRGNVIPSSPTHLCDLCGYDPFPLSSSSHSQCCQEVGQKPIFVPILLWPRHGPCSSEEKGRCGCWPRVCPVLSRVPWPQLPLCSLTRDTHDPSHSRDCPWQCPPLSACCRKILRELETYSVFKWLNKTG